MVEGQSCLIHSINGKSRASTVIIAYLMKKYCWSLEKCFDFVTFKKDKFSIRTNFLNQLEGLEKRLLQIYNLTNTWSQSTNEEDLILANTFKNSKVPNDESKKAAKKDKRRISWG